MSEAVSTQRPCPNCGREWGSGGVCESCDQVDGFETGIQLSSAGRRLGAYVLDGVLVFVTLFIGYLIWTVIVWKDGQSPGKQLMSMRVVRTQTGSKATWGTMFLRDFIGKGIIGTVAGFTIVGLILYLWLLWDPKRQQLWDRMAGTLVVDDPHQKLLQV